uniref:LysM domain-containing protein n=1 Tax=Romanomermis culicivorax TaxID=13658 RepID=A0A915K7D4_ROMCU
MPDENVWYTVQVDDTIERIAAKLNVTPGQLRAMNKISGAILFPGQKLKLPSTAILSPSIVDYVQSSKNNVENCQIGAVTLGTKTQDDVEITTSFDEKPKFLKIKSKYFTKEYGTASGLLLITSNSIMFEPDLMHPLIVEHGAANYTVSVPLQALASVG